MTASEPGPDGARPPRAGLLPMYVALYDEVRPEARAQFQPLLEGVCGRLEQRGLAVTCADVCRLADEFAAAVDRFEQEGVDCIVTLHLAYSPSLESADALCRTPLPLVMLDATMDAAFGRDVDPARIMYNHGIHGVQDLASVLVRRGRAFEIVAGHAEDDALLDRAADLVRAAGASRRLRGLRAVRIGKAFAGMGDFSVPPELLARRFDITVETRRVDELAAITAKVTDDRIEAELAADRERFDCQAPAEVHRRSVRLGLGVRDLLAGGNFSAFSANFQAFDTPDEPICTVPFLEICKAMARGVGYGGEGDVLTASLLAGLLAAWPQTTFTEMFCPDWAGGALFLSHMGEVNPAVLDGRPVVREKDYSFSAAQNPAFVTGPWKTGPATLVNLAPGPAESFRLIVAPLEVLRDGTHPDMARAIRAWARPALPLAPFLEAYSRLGGTHHCALARGDHAEAMEAIGRFLGIETTTIA